MILKTRRAESMVQYVMFTILVVMTPFVVVTRFLQGTVYEISHFKINLFGAHIPLVAAFAVGLFVAFLIWIRRDIKPRRVGGILVIICMIALSQWVQDLYGGMSVYDLQKNWHYAAYCAYVFFFFRAFNRRGMPMNRMILFTFISAIGLSTFDETFQFFLSDRIFDVSDIAKDSWGAMIGLIMVIFVTESYGAVNIEIKRLWKRRLSEYLRDPLSVFMICGTLSLLAILISPLLTDHEYIGTFVLILAVCYAVVLGVWHFLQFKLFRAVFLGSVGLVLVLLAVSFVIHRNDQITSDRFGLTVYKGIPVPFFDLLIYPNGLPRLADKKHFFNVMDRQFMLEQKPSILLIGSGHLGRGGQGFKVKEGVYMAFNRYTLKGTQIIVLPTPRACQVFNRLKSAGKNVMFIIHSTC